VLFSPRKILCSGKTMIYLAWTILGITLVLLLSAMEDPFKKIIDFLIIVMIIVVVSSIAWSIFYLFSYYFILPDKS